MAFYWTNCTSATGNKYLSKAFSRAWLKDNKLISTIKPEKRYYHISKMVTTEAAIYHAFLQDYYLVLGDKTTDGWSIKLYQNPLVMLIWIGAFIMMLSGLIALKRK